MIYRPFNLQLDELAAYNIENRDRTIAQLRRDLKRRNKQLSDAQKVAGNLSDIDPLRTNRLRKSNY